MLKWYTLALVAASILAYLALAPDQPDQLIRALDRATRTHHESAMSHQDYRKVVERAEIEAHVPSIFALGVLHANIPEGLPRGVVRDSARGVQCLSNQKQSRASFIVLCA